MKKTILLSALAIAFGLSTSFAQKTVNNPNVDKSNIKTVKIDNKTQTLQKTDGAKIIKPADNKATMTKKVNTKKHERFEEVKATSPKSIQLNK